MKKIGWIMMLFLIVSSFSTKLAAQENLDALIKKCETMTSVDISVVRTKNPQTKELEREMINITIKGDAALINEFVAAFKKDEKNAIKAIEDKKGGRIKSLFYTFENTTYSLTFGEMDFSATGFYNEKEGFASLSKITTSKEKNNSK